VFALDVLNDGLVHLVAGNSHGAAVNNSRKRYDRDIRGASADIADHIAAGFRDRHAGADSGDNGLLHQVNFACLRAQSRFLHGAFFHLSDFRRNADNDTGAKEVVPAVRLFNKILQHHFRDIKIGNDSVLHRLDGDNVCGRPSKHLLSSMPDSQHLLIGPVQRDDRRLVYNNPAALGINKGIGRSEIDSQVTGKKSE